jgi:hypothetical protein
VTAELAITAQTSDLTTLEQQALDRNPAAVYLASLENETSRRTMRGALDTIAGLLIEGSDAFTLPWPSLRFQHTTAIRSKLSEIYAPATANKNLSALRGVLGASFDLGLMGAEDYQRAVKVKGIKGENLRRRARTLLGAAGKKARTSAVVLVPPDGQEGALGMTVQ